MTTWNPSDKAASIALTNGNLTATQSSGGGTYSGVRSTTSKTSGKFVFKLTNVAYVNAGGLGFGISNATDDLANWGGHDTNGVSIYESGGAWRGGSQISVPLGLSGPFYAIDIDNGTLQTSADGTAWNGPYTFTMPTGADFYVRLTTLNSTDTATADFAPTGWTLSGFANWDVAAAAARPIGGGWVPESKQAAQTRKARKRKERATWDAIERDLAKTYAKATRTAPEEAKEAVKEALRPRDPAIVQALADTLALSPDPAAALLLARIEAQLADLQGAIVFERRARDEEETAIALLLVA